VGKEFRTKRTEKRRQSAQRKAVAAPRACHLLFLVLPGTRGEHKRAFPHHYKVVRTKGSAAGDVDIGRLTGCRYCFRTASPARVSTAPGDSRWSAEHTLLVGGSRRLSHPDVFARGLRACLRPGMDGARLRRPPGTLDIASERDERALSACRYNPRSPAVSRSGTEPEWATSTAARTRRIRICPDFRISLSAAIRSDSSDSKSQQKPCTEN
jgi:hypothetical protein